MSYTSQGWFLTLPVEIRTEIYSHYCDSVDVKLRVHIWNDAPIARAASGRLVVWEKHANPPALIRTCKSIKAEFMDYLFTRQTVYFTINGSDSLKYFPASEAWVKKMLPKIIAARIREIALSNNGGAVATKLADRLEAMEEWFPSLKIINSRAVRRLSLEQCVCAAQ
jgi:hypothetical protein